MKISNKRILSLVLAVIMTVAMTLSLSSCFLLNFSLEDLIPEDIIPDLEDDNGLNNGLGNIIPGGGNVTPNFYPGSGSGSVDNVSAENRTLLSTVSIFCTFSSGPAAGSGVIFSIDKASGTAYIVTNYHVIYYNGIASKIEVYLYGMHNVQYAIPATFVGGSISNDIAVLKIENSDVIKNSYAMAAPFADSDEVRAFDKAIVVGNPEGAGIAATTGIISVESETLEIAGADDSLISLRVMRTDAPVNLGNSGGGMYNENGEVIGIICAKLASDTVDCVGYAIPSTLAKNLIINILDNCNGTTQTQVLRPLIGISVIADSMGLVVDPVTGEISQKHITTVYKIEESCVIKNKLKIGDIVNSITIKGETKQISQTYQLPDTMLKARVGDIVTMSVTRGENTFDISFEVTSKMVNPID